MKQKSIATIRLYGRIGKLLRLYAKDHRISMGEFLEKIFERIPIEDLMEETSDILSYEERRNEPTVPFEDVLKQIQPRQTISKPKKVRSRKK